MLELKQGYINAVVSGYNGSFLEALKFFDSIAENNLRNLLRKHYNNHRSEDQAWKTCKGSLYEYAVFKCLQNIVKNNTSLTDKVEVVMGDDGLNSHKDQIVIRNWSDIFPDVDILLVEKETNLVKAIVSCKTSLRERLTETAFWKRELEKNKNMADIHLFFVTTDKDNELRTETNRYILLHVVDVTFITDPIKYKKLVEHYKEKYGYRKDFNQILRKVKLIDEIENFMHNLIS